ncbi:MAG: hypothetical protein ACXAAH_08665 [Promethearchaeota archaeon]|jgi:hypothetical protein
MNEIEREKKKPSTTKILIGVVCIGVIIIIITLATTIMFAVNEIMAQYTLP